MEKKSSLSTLLFGVALLLFVTATFAMFGKVVVRTSGGGYIPNMFQAAFGTSAGADGVRVPGLTAIFSFQMIILAGVAAIIFGTVTRKFHYILTIVIFGIVCLCSFITFIISFNAGNLWLAKTSRSAIEYTLGAGPIAYSVMHILGLLASAAGLVFSRRGA